MHINEVMLDEKIFIIIPEGSFRAADFERLTEEVGPVIEAMRTRNGLMIYTGRSSSKGSTGVCRGRAP